MKNEALFLICSDATVVSHEQPKVEKMSTRASLPKGYAMDKILIIEDLDKLPDAFLLTDRVIDGQEGALLLLISRSAHNLVSIGYNKVMLWLFIPIDIIDALVTMFESEGLHLSYG
jgi:hypothetical protein